MKRLTPGVDCDGWRPRLRADCTNEARWAIVHVSRPLSPAFVRCAGCARTYRRDPGFMCTRIEP